eukprot:TRINITY_DN33639_c0_g1_i1.p1 TRINITY_DN33639_c0_g1~~TRINITY_DN33639_c0_g1_i1.p1  ORF type:complete len:730 (+),score=149.61 TRINITY_DN33639_c0_g1_i1:50-2239(+)
MGGFPYLGGLPKGLASVPRIPTPRQKVPAGTVGIAAGQTGIYTLTTPGGWNLLGETPANLFDPTADPPAMLRAGDLVKFVPTDIEPVSKPVVEVTEETTPDLANPWMKVLSAGPMTTVQDMGRRGYARHGVSRSGAADELSLRMGNSLLGNPDHAAGLEVALGGLKFRMLRPCAISLTGADCAAKVSRAGCGGSVPLPVNQVAKLLEGDELTLGYADDGARAYVCVQGGVDVPVVLGSRSTDVRGALGGLQGRVLEAGDSLGRGDSEADPELVAAAHDPLRAVTTGSGGKTWRLRLLPGPGDPGMSGSESVSDELRALVGPDFNVLPRSDRMAVCLAPAGAASEGEELVGGEQLSEACVSGTVQVPPDGNPLILLAEHQTTGGYKVPGVVIPADLWQVGQMRPGDKLQFAPTTPEEADAALQQMHSLAQQNQPGAGLRFRLPEPQLERSQCSAEHPGAMKTNPDYSSRTRSSYLPNPVGFTRSFNLIGRRARGLRRIDLNADCGEGFDDAGLLEYVTSVNVCCNEHAGTSQGIANVVRMASELQAGVGAHVSFEDRENFGRVALHTPAEELKNQVLGQVGFLQGLCLGANTRVRYIKPHGALYHATMAGGEQGKAVFEAAQLVGLPLLLMPSSPWATYGEGFSERAYDGDQLRPRDKEGAVIHDPVEAAAQGVALAQQSNIHSICVHGDSPNAVVVAKAVRIGLEEAGFELGPFSVSYTHLTLPTKRIV